jgi:hypothetical protein
VEPWASHESDGGPGCYACFGLFILGMLILIVIGVVTWVLFNVGV